MQAELTNLGQSAIQSLQAIANNGVSTPEEVPKGEYERGSILLDKASSQQMAGQLISYLQVM